MNMEVTKVFISSVTDEFGSYRRRLHEALDDPGFVAVIRQENVGSDRKSVV